MPSLVPVDHDPFAASPLQGPGLQPPGTHEGRMVARENAPDASMVGLSSNAQSALNMMPVFGFMGDRAGVQGQMDILNSDPTYLARKKQAEAMGTNAAQLSAKQQAATGVLGELNSLETKLKAWKQHAPSAYNAATGPYNSNEYVQYATGWANRGGQALNTLLHHDIEKLAGLYRDLPSAQGGSGTDAQDANFKSAMGKWLESPDPDNALAVLASAKDMIRTKGGLAHDFEAPSHPLRPEDVAAINRYAQVPIDSNSPFVTGGLKLGEVRKGYRYLGGPPDDPASWRRLPQQKAEQ